LQPTGSVGINTPSTGTAPHQCFTYDIDLIFVTAKGAFKQVAALPVIESDFASQGFAGLIGRDVLTDFRITYSGPDNVVWLSY
jgi:hypothetical protein